MTGPDLTDDLLSLLLAEDGFDLPGDGPAPIPRLPDGAVVPAAPAQERLWVLDRVEGPSPAYNLAMILRFGGAADLDRSALQTALNGLSERHEPLRTDLTEHDGRPVQRIHPPAPVPLPVETVTADALHAAILRTALAPFDLGRGPLFRARWFEVAGGPDVLLLAFHHAVVDGWSVAVMIRDLARLYAAALTGTGAGLPPLPIRYRDYAAWCADPAREAEREDARAYWRRRLDALPAALDLPRAGTPDGRGGLVPLRLDAGLTARLERFGQERGATLYMVLLAGYAALLARFTGARDLPIGTPVANRTRTETEGLVGFLVDTLVVRADVSGEPDFATLTERVRDACLEDFRHQHLPFSALVALLKPERRAGSTPLFQAMFNLLTLPAWEERAGPVQVVGEAVALPVARFDLALELQADGGAVSGRLEYRAGLIADAVAQAMAAAYVTLLTAALDDPRRPIDALPLMERAAAAAWVARTNGPETPAPADTLHGLFARRAAENPAAVALIDGGTAVTYATLDRQSAALAARLRTLGVGNEVPVGVCLERSAALAVALLGVLRAGGAVLPLDPGYPPERLAFMVADSGAPVLIARAPPPWLPDTGPVLVDPIANDQTSSPPLPPGQDDGGRPDGLAYLIYTSGSTGRPKGVMGLHQGAVNRIRWMEEAFPFAPGEVTCQKTAITFVDFIWEFFGPLLAGVPSVIVPPDAAGDPLRLAEVLERGCVTRLVLVPSLLRALLDGVPDPASTLRALRLCVTSGEAISADLAARFAEALPHCRLLNLYGSSEVSADATWHVVEPDTPGLVPIGRPIPGNRVLLLDRGNNPVPPGAPGEIAIGGVGLARGYAGQPGLTAERFTDDPTGLAGGRLFRTGDLGRWRADGVLDYLGRLDRQVKIRGVRVEPGEVQAVLSGHPAVREAAVVARPLPSGETGLVAYVVWRGEAALAELRPFLRARLPAALVPAAFVTLDRLPLNPNGKTDLAALPAPAATADEGAEDGTPARPLAPDEALVAAVWAEVLGISVTGGGCDFFDHGGDSLLAVRAMTRVNAAFGTALPVAALFDAPTPRALAGRLRAAGGGADLPPVPTGPRPARLPMSFNQVPLWLAERAQGAAAYNVPTAYRLDGPVNEEALEHALAGLYDRHEGLRTRLTAHGDEPVQEIMPPGGFRLERRSAVGLAGEALDAVVTAEAARPFALDAEAPFRATLFTLGPDARLLLLVIHHTACDGTTGALLVREMEAGYRGIALRPPAVQPADIALWQRACLDGGAFGAALDGWRADLTGAPMRLDLPRPAGAAEGEAGTGRAGRVPVALPPGALDRLAAIAREGRATLPMALMAAWGVLLSRATGQDDLLIGIPAAARVRREMEETAGFLVNTLPLRVTLDGDPDFVAVVTRVRQRLLTALERQHVPLPLVAEAVKAPRLPGRPPLVQALFVQQDARAWSLSLPGITAAALPVPTPVARFDLTLLVVDRDGGLTGELEYDTAVVDDAMARRMAERFTAILTAVAEAPHQPLSALDLLGDGDRRLNATLNAGTHDGPRPVADRLDALVRHQATVRAEAPALWWPGSTLSYGALDRRSSRFARRLAALGIGPGARVGLVAERGPGLFIALVGILKAGAAYVPVDPAYPAERIAGMLGDADAAAVVAEAAPPALTVPCLFPDEGEDDGGPLPDAGGGGDAVACLIFTSGSTGRPKGVMVRHRALCRLAATLVDRYAIGPDSRIQQLVALGFDVAASDIAMAFTAGAALCLAPRDGLLPGRTLTQTLAASAATHVQIPAALLAATPVVPLPALRVLAVGGESCPADTAARWAAGRRLFFAYGPTETTVTATVAEYAPGLSPACIGRPVAGALAFVRGPHGQPVPPGTAGELCIGGEGVAAGYYGQPELTAARFVPDAVTGGTLYRTGDRVRLGDDGNLLFLGRLDRQVKLHGFRIEPGEIEAALTAQPGVARALVAVRPGAGDGDRGLAAFLLPAAGARLDVAAVRGAVRAVLPPHMVPSAFTVIATVPLTLHGKVDWDALFALPPTPVPTAPSAATLSAVQERVAALWRAVLGRDSIGLDETFFDAGGHSLRLVRVHARLEEVFARTLPITDLFRLPTIRSLAAHLAGAGAAAETPPATADGSSLGGPVAVIGMACRYPGAPDVESFWRLLVEGREGIARLDAAALAAEGLDPALLDQPGHVPARGVVDGADLFDAAFFGFSPRDAVVMDPQHRVLLECAWHALEDAGYDPARAGGPVGVFAGAGLNTYFHGVLHADGPAPEGAAAYHELTGNDKDFIATQIAYRLDLRGPAVAVQSACSTSLVAVDLACQALRAGRCRMALAGGVSIRFPQATGYRYEPGMILSPDGHCRPFAGDAAGTVPGGGAGLVLLKPLALAQADGDRILAVIRGTAVTNDGAAKVGYTAPGADGQTAAIAAAIADAGLDPATIDYVETHGTGTALGDPVEVAALARVFGGRDRPLLLGAVKSNIGHADAAAGVAGLIKTVLALHHGTVPPTLHAHTLNPRIDFAAGPFAVAAEAQPWPAGGGPRRAGVSAFGIGGTNAHVVLEQAPPAPAEPPAGGPHLLLLSARSDAALEQQAAALAAHLAANPALPLADVAHTLSAGRAVFDHRAAAVVRDVPDAVRALSAPALIRATAPERPPAVALLFPGQGSQSPRMGEALYRTSPAYREALDRCAAVLEPHIGADLRALLYGPEDRAADAAALRRTSLTQPALFSVGYATAHHWQALGVEPVAMLGHSVGEYVAACLAGVFTLEDALALVAERGRLVDGLPAGAMLALPLAEDEAAALLHGTGLSIAAVNGPRQVVVAGPTPSITALQGTLDARGVRGWRLATSHAFHSAMLDPVVPAFTARVAAVTLRAPERRFVSNVTGTWITAEQATDPAYWAQHLRHAVRFADGIAILRDSGAGLLLEAGPGHTLCALARSAGWNRPAIATLDAGPLEAVGQLWAAGVPVTLPPTQGRRVALPPYPFQRKRFWPERTAPAPALPAPALPAPALPAKRAERDSWFYQPVWRQASAPATAPLTGPWLVLAGRDGTGARLAEALAARGEAVTVVPVAAITDDTPLFSPPPARIVHLGCLDGDDALERGFHSLTTLARALGTAGVVQPVRIDVVTTGTADVTGEEVLNPAAAAALGAVKIIPLEYPAIRCRAIDIPPGLDTTRLLDELAVEDTAPHTALRGRRRWQPDIVPAPLPPAGNGLARLRPRGVYLVTGGFGGMGAAIARDLAETLQARLVLVGRTPLPPPDEAGDDPRYRLIDAIEAAGGAVLAAAADVADETAMAAVIAQARARFGAINGVIHTAGLADRGGVIQTRTRADTDAVLAPKVAGTLVLDRLLADGPSLDVMLLCSTLGSILHGAKFGQVAYAGGNEFLDLFAAERTARTGQFTQAINWDDWTGGGMTVAAYERWGHAAPSEAQALTPAEGVAVFRRALDSPLTRLAVSIRDLPALAARGAGLMDDLARHTAPAAVPGAGPAAVPPDGGDGSTQGLLAGCWRSLLGVERVDRASDFFALGGHSLLAMQMLAFIRATFGVEIGLATLFEAPVLADLAARIDALSTPTLPVPTLPVPTLPVNVPAEDEEEFML